jgi:hypothetical protein
MKPKKVLMLLLSLVMVATASNLTASASNVNDFVVINGELVAYYGSDLDVVIPDTLGITSIGRAAFGDVNHNNKITSVIIPNGVISVGMQAFYQCKSLKSVTLPDSLTAIEESAFASCPGLTSISIPKGVTEIGWTAFWGDESLTSVNIAEGVKVIKNSAFADCTSLTSITIPASVTAIESTAFGGCINLMNVTLGSKNTSIAEDAFAGTKYASTKVENTTDTEPTPISSNGIDFSNWILRSPDRVPGNQIVCGKGIYVSVGAGGMIQTSSDAVNWSFRVSNTSAYLNDIAYGNNTYVAVGQDTDLCACFLTSSDTQVWSTKKLDFGSKVRAIAYGNGVFAAVVNGFGTDDVGKSYIYTSKNGVDWTAAVSEFNRGEFNDITFGNGVFAVACQDMKIMTSPDGVTWTNHKFDGMSSNYGKTGEFSIAHIANGNGMFVIDIGLIVFISTDCEHWKSSSFNDRQSVQTLEFLNGKFYLTCEAGYIFRSNDGADWIRVPSNAPKNDWMSITSMAYGNGVFFAISSTYSLRSNDGSNWILCSKGYTENANLSSAAYGNGIYVAYACGDFLGTKHSESAVSTDGVNWTAHYLGSHVTSRMVFGNGVFIVGESDATAKDWPYERVGITTDGVNWSYKKLPEGNTGTVDDIIYDNGFFYLAGADRANSGDDLPKLFIERSPDGVHWERVMQTNANTDGNRRLYLSCGNGVLIAKELETSNYYISNDGVNWKNKQAADDLAYTVVSFTNGIFVINGFSGTVWTSTDGLMWTKRTITVNGHAAAENSTYVIPYMYGDRYLPYAYGNGYYVATGKYRGVPNLFTSLDGVNWSICTSGTADTPRCLLGDVFYLNGTFYMLNGCKIVQLGSIATSSDVPLQVAGKSTTLSAYAVGGHNYIKIRDLATLLNGTAKQYSVSYDAGAGAISIISGKAYTPVGGELSGAAGFSGIMVSPTAVNIVLDGKTTTLEAYNFSGFYYFKLRDIAAALNFGVSYDNKTGIIGIDPTTGYLG